MPTPKYSPTQFKTVYAPLKAKGLTKKQIAGKMKVSTRTIERYMANPDYVEVVSVATKQAEHQELIKGENHSDKIIEAAYRLHEKGIQDAINDKDYEEARRISIDALRIAKTEAEIKRIFMIVGNLNIDARDQSQTLIIQQEVRKDIDNFMQAVWQILTPKQQRQIQELAKEKERVK